MILLPWWWDDRPLTGWRKAVGIFGAWCAVVAATCLLAVVLIVLVGIIATAVA